MAVTIARTPWVDDDGTGTTGTVINNAEKTLLYNQIDQALAQVSAGGNVITVVPSGAYTVLATDDHVIFQGAGTATLQAAGVYGKKRMEIRNAAAGTGLVTVAASTGNIDGYPTVKLGPGEALTIRASEQVYSWIIVARNGFTQRVAAALANAQTLQPSVITKIGLDYTEWNPFGEFAAAKWTCSEPGDYHVNAQGFLIAITGRAQLFLYKNGGYVAVSQGTAQASDVIGQVEWNGRLLAGDYVELYAFHSDSLARTVQPGAAHTFLTVDRRR